MLDKIYLAGGCFWCTEAIFKRVEGVENILPGYIGGKVKDPTYSEVCAGTTGHAEAISLEYNERIISLKDLLFIYFQTHDPTQLNGQGNDIGNQYRSAIFYTSIEQKESIDLIISDLLKTSYKEKLIVTQVQLALKFYVAEKEHINYYNKNSNESYCKMIIFPKLKKLEKVIYKET
jgi:peptide-methionine (S)-S-oxide reductase